MVGGVDPNVGAVPRFVVAVFDVNPCGEWEAVDVGRSGFDTTTVLDSVGTHDFHLYHTRGRGQFMQHWAVLRLRTGYATTHPEVSQPTFPSVEPSCVQ